jgi:GT2 family glycosyltransferase
MTQTGGDGRLAVVVATRDRRASLLTTLAHLRALPEQPSIVVVDNGSQDGTPKYVQGQYPGIEVIALGRNLGAAARTIGARQVDTPYVAFSDDDSWWAPGALSRSVELLDTYPSLALLAAKILVGPEERLEPACLQMATSPLPSHDDLPGQPVLGFVACGAVVRRSAFLTVGGFHVRFGIGGEEELLAIDLAAAGWTLAYVSEVVAHHFPSPIRNRQARQQIVLRNALWATWLRRPWASAARRTAQLAGPAVRDAQLRPAIIHALRGLPWILRERRATPSALDSALRVVEAPLH